MIELVDAHFQLGEDHWLSRHESMGLDGVVGNAHKADLADLQNVADRLESMDVAHLGAGIVPFPSAEDRDYGAANELILGAAHQDLHGRQLRRWPIYAINPQDARGLEWLCAKLEAREPCAGIKLNPFLGRAGGYDLPSLADDQKLVDVLIKHDLFVAMHVGTGREHVTRPGFPNVSADPRSAIELARRIPEVRMFCFHLLRASESALEDAAALPNVFVDTSGIAAVGRMSEGGSDVMPAEDPVRASSPESLVQHLVSEIGLGDTLVFGSAYPFCTWWGSSVEGDVQIFLGAEIGDRDRRAILAGNALRLFGQTA